MAGDEHQQGEDTWRSDDWRSEKDPEPAPRIEWEATQAESAEPEDAPEPVAERQSEPLTDPLPDPLDESRPLEETAAPTETRSLRESWPMPGPSASTDASAAGPAAGEQRAPAAEMSGSSAQHFQDWIALRREAEESAAAALHERREATSQASRIIEEAMRASEALQAEAQQELDRRRTAAESEAATILASARAEAAEIVRAGENDVAEAQRLRSEASAERERINGELERIRRTAQEELFAEANRHAARMDEIRTRVLHGVEAITGGLREPVREPLAAVEPSPARTTEVRSPVVAEAPADPAPLTVHAPPAQERAAEPESAPASFWGTTDPAPATQATRTTPTVTPPPGIPADAPITPYTPSSSDAAAGRDRDSADEHLNRGKRGWRSRRS